MAFLLSSVALPATMASRAAKAAANQGSSSRSCASLDPRLPGGRDADGHGARSDQNELADAFWVPGHVQRREVRAGGVRERVQPVKIKVLAQGLDIIDKPVAAVGGGVLRYRGPAGAPMVHHDQLPMRRQAAEFTEVGGVRIGPPGRQITGAPSPNTW